MIKPYEQSEADATSDDLARPPAVRYDSALMQGQPCPVVKGLEPAFAETLRMLHDVLRRTDEDFSFELTGSINSRTLIGSDTSPESAEESEPETFEILPARFTVIRRLGRGGFGTVYLAEDHLLQRFVAVKIPHANVLLSEELRQRFQREWRAVARLNHPNLVRVLDVGVDGERLWQVGEYVEGETLKSLIRCGRFQPAFHEIARLMRDLADGVQHAHEQGVLHRDIKPDNILIERIQAVDAIRDEPPLRPRLMDFGLARLMDEDIHLSRNGTLIGTPKYMAPEQLTGQTADVDARTDIFALGVVLHELLCGKVPFPEAKDVVSRMGLLDKPIQRIPARSSEQLPLRIPRDLETICLKCLRTKPDDRYPNARELRDDLQRFLDGRPTLARPVPWFESLGRWMLRRPALASALCVCLLLLTGIVGFGYWHVVRLGELNKSLQALSNDRERQAIEAEKSRQQAEDVAFLSSQREFSAEIMQASNLWLNARPGDMNEVLMRFHPLSKESSLPDFAQRFEWNYLWRQGANLRAWKRHDADVAAVAVSTNHQTAFTIGHDDRIVCWDVASGLPLDDWLLPRKNDSSEYVISRDLSTGLILQRHYAPILDEVLIVEMSSGKILFRREYANDTVDAVAISDDGQLAVLAGSLNRKDSPEPFLDLVNTRNGQVSTERSLFDGLRLEGQPTIVHTSTAVTFRPGSYEFLLTPIVNPPGFWRFLLLKVSPDAVRNEDGSIRNWKVSGTMEYPSPMPGVPLAGDWSRDGKRCVFLSNSDSPWAGVWDIDQVRLLATTSGHPEEVYAAAFNGTGDKILLSVSQPGLNSDGKPVQKGELAVERSRNELLLWDYGVNRMEHMEYSPARSILQIACLPEDGQDSWIMAESGGTLFHWRPTALTPAVELNAHPNSESWALVYTADGTSLFSAGDDHCVRRWNSLDRSMTAQSKPREQLVSCLALSPDNRFLAAGGYDDTVLIHEADSLKEVTTLKGHAHDLRAVAFSKDSQYLATAGRDRIVKIWSVPDFELLSSLPAAGNTVRGLAWRRNGQLIVSDSSGNVCLYSPDGRPLLRRKFREGANAIALLPKKISMPTVRFLEFLAESASPDTASPEVAEPLSTDQESSMIPQDHRAESQIMTVNADDLLVVAGNHGSVSLWHLPSDQLLRQFEMRGVELMAVAFSPDGQSLATAGRSESVSIWDVATGRKTLTLTVRGAPVHAVTFSPDQKTLSAALHDGRVLMFQAGD